MIGDLQFLTLIGDLLPAQQGISLFTRRKYNISPQSEQIGKLYEKT